MEVCYWVRIVVIQGSDRHISGPNQSRSGIGRSLISVSNKNLGFDHKIIRFHVYHLG